MLPSALVRLSVFLDDLDLELKVRRPARRNIDLGREVVPGIARHLDAAAGHDAFLTHTRDLKRVVKAFVPAGPQTAKPPTPEASSIRQDQQLHYRHVNQGEEFRVADLVAQGNRFRQTIPGDYTDSPYPLQYYFECLAAFASRPLLFPGFDGTWSNRPYFAVPVRRGSSD